MMTTPKTKPKTKKKEMGAPIPLPDLSKACSLLTPEGFVKHLVEKLQQTEDKLQVFAGILSYFVFKKNGTEIFKLSVEELKSIDKSYLHFKGKNVSKTGFYEMRVTFEDE